MLNTAFTKVVTCDQYLFKLLLGPSKFSGCATPLDRSKLNQ